MKRTITRSSSSVTLTLVSGGLEENEPALSPFGLVRAGLITTRTQSTPTESLDLQLTELLNSLEKKVAALVCKSYEVLNTYEQDTSHRVMPTDIHYGMGGTK